MRAVQHAGAGCLSRAGVAVTEQQQAGRRGAGQHPGLCRFCQTSFVEGDFCKVRIFVFHIPSVCGGILKCNWFSRPPRTTRQAHGKHLLPTEEFLCGSSGPSTRKSRRPQGQACAFASRPAAPAAAASTVLSRARMWSPGILRLLPVFGKPRAAGVLRRS